MNPSPLRVIVFMQGGFYSGLPPPPGWVIYIAYKKQYDEVTG
jgi:hypothetical protein